VPKNPALFEYVALEANKVLIGSLSLHALDDGTYNVNFTTFALGDTLDPDELKLMLHTAALTGERLGTEIHEKFGGMRWGG
jgi:hypothetical protein